MNLLRGDSCCEANGAVLVVYTFVRFRSHVAVGNSPPVVAPQGHNQGQQEAKAANGGKRNTGGELGYAFIPRLCRSCASMAECDCGRARALRQKRPNLREAARPETLLHNSAQRRRRAADTVMHDERLKDGLWADRAPHAHWKNTHMTGIARGNDLDVYMSIFH